jgi:hypothetical protein
VGITYLSTLPGDLLAVGSNTSDRELHPDSKLPERVVMSAGFKTIDVITKYDIVLIANIDLNIGPLVFIKEFEFISDPGRKE